MSVTSNVNRFFFSQNHTQYLHIYFLQHAFLKLILLAKPIAKLLRGRRISPARSAWWPSLVAMGQIMGIIINVISQAVSGSRIAKGISSSNLCFARRHVNLLIHYRVSMSHGCGSKPGTGHLGWPWLSYLEGRSLCGRGGRTWLNDPSPHIFTDILVAFLLLVTMPGAPSSFLFLMSQIFAWDTWNHRIALEKAQRDPLENLRLAVERAEAAGVEEDRVVEVALQGKFN